MQGVWNNPSLSGFLTSAVVVFQQTQLFSAKPSAKFLCFLKVSQQMLSSGKPNQTKQNRAQHSTSPHTTGFFLTRHVLKPGRNCSFPLFCTLRRMPYLLPFPPSLYLYSVPSLLQMHTRFWVRKYFCRLLWKPSWVQLQWQTQETDNWQWPDPLCCSFGRNGG